MDAVFLGRATLDISYIVRDFPVENEKVFAEASVVQPGGPALNAAVTFSLLGGKAAVVSCFGSGTFGSLVKARATNLYNLDVVDMAEDVPFDLPVSSIIVGRGNGSRTILNAPPQAFVPKLSPADLDRIGTPDLLLLDGYNLEGNLAGVVEWRRRGAVVVLDGGSWKATSREFLPYVHIAVCSDRFRVPGLDREGTIREMHRLGVEKVAFTREAEPVLVSGGTGLKEIPVPPVEAVDTLGAGDVFHGAFCYHYRQTRDFERSVELAAGTAAESCRHYGTHTWARRGRRQTAP